MKGMTAFGKAKGHDDKYQVAIEISSVNRRHAELVVKVSSGYQELEGLVRKELLKAIHRGQVTVSIDIEPLSMETFIPAPNWLWIDAQVNLAEQISKRLGAIIKPEKVAIELWKQICTQERGRECADLVPLLLQTLDEAFVAFERQRREEGDALAKDCAAHLFELRSFFQKIAETSKGHVEHIRDKITTVLKSVVSEPFTQDERVMREIVLQADKADISEELTRIEHHLDHAEKILDGSAPVGKLFEFLLQELLREFNTLGAKTVFPAVSTMVVLAKTELEKMREQIQNVE